MKRVIKRFLQYVSYETTSDEKSKTSPSTKGQLTFARALADELRQLGLKEIHLNNSGYLTASLPGNTPHSHPVIGFIAHLDTSPDCSGKNVQPKIISNYMGSDILLNPEQQIYLKPEDFPELLQYHGQDLIVTNGLTLLGADDKAGIAEIMTAVEYLLNNPQIKRTPIRIAFTPDEEIGRGADGFNVEDFGADFAYTVDGGELGQFETENFNAATAVVKIKGRNVHPGTAKNKMINSLLLAGEIINKFPANEIPALTEGYQGFYHLYEVTGTVEESTLAYLIRDHDRDSFEERKRKIRAYVDEINTSYNSELVSANIIDSYYNMKEILIKHPYISNLAISAMNELGIKPYLSPIRGGTDGARLSFMGLPSPNLFTGGHNFHSRYEFIPIPSLIKATQTIVKICELGLNL